MIFLDCEASGLLGYPIEIGFARVLPDRSITSAARLIRHDEWLDELQLWDWQAEGLHGITRPHLVEHGQPVGAVARWLNDQLAGRLVVIDSELDRRWVDMLMVAAGVDRQFGFVDVAEAFAGDEVDRQAYGVLVQDLYERRAHRAAADAEQWAEVYVNSLGYGWPVREIRM